MTLERYRRKRLVILNPSASVYDAARAMQDNRVGCVIVRNGNRVVGIVTDRDLAMRVIARGLEPRQTRIEDVMSPGPRMLSVTDSPAQALSLMRRHGVRRVPLLDGDAVAGLVTLDDLVLSPSTDPELIADVVRAQLSEPARLKPAGVVHPLETARTEVPEPSKPDLIERLQEMVGLQNRDRALLAHALVASRMFVRLSSQEALAFLSRLPVPIRDRLFDLRDQSSEPIEQQLAQSLDIDLRSARELAERIEASLLPLSRAKAARRGAIRAW